jgi:hypothetical protein
MTPEQAQAAQAIAYVHPAQPDERDGSQAAHVVA